MSAPLFCRTTCFSSLLKKCILEVNYFNPCIFENCFILALYLIFNLARYKFLIGNHFLLEVLVLIFKYPMQFRIFILFWFCEIFSSPFWKLIESSLCPQYYKVSWWTLLWVHFHPLCSIFLGLCHVPFWKLKSLSSAKHFYFFDYFLSSVFSALFSRTFYSYIALMAWSSNFLIF